MFTWWSCSARKQRRCCWFMRNVNWRKQNVWHHRLTAGMVVFIIFVLMFLLIVWHRVLGYRKHLGSHNSKMAEGNALESEILEVEVTLLSKRTLHRRRLGNSRRLYRGPGWID